MAPKLPPPKNRMVEENGRDIDELSDDTPTRQGNAYGVQPDAAANFRDDAANRATELRRQADILDNEAAQWDAIAKGFVEA